MPPVVGINQTEQSMPAVATSTMWRGMMETETTPRTPWGRSVPTNWVYTICRATFLNGVRIGMAITAAFLRRIRKALPPVLIVCCVGAVGAMMRGTAVSRAATASAPTAGTTTSGCASPSPVYNEDLLSEKSERRTPENTRPADPTRRQAARQKIIKHSARIQTESVPPDMPGGTLSV